MSLRALIYAYVLGGITFIPLVVFALIFFTIYTSVPVGRDYKPGEKTRAELEAKDEPHDNEEETQQSTLGVSDLPRTRKGWLTVRRTFEETAGDGSYVALMRNFLDARSKDPKKSRPRDMWYVVLKGKVLYLYEDEAMSECEAAIEMSGHDVTIYPEGLLDGELFSRRNAICLRPKAPPEDTDLPSLTKEMKLEKTDVEEAVAEVGGSEKKQDKERDKLLEEETQQDAAREEALSNATPWFIFVRCITEMEDWYLALIHASDNPPNSSTLTPLLSIFRPADMGQLVTTLDEQPDVIPMRWLNALIGRLFFSYYRTDHLEKYIIGRLMKKISKVKRPTFLSDIVVTDVSVGNKAPSLSKPMLKELTKEGDAAFEIHFSFKGEFRMTIEATAVFNIGAFNKSYTAKLVLAVIIRELEGNLLIKVKRPPSARIWYAFTQTPRMVFAVEPIVSERQITWSMVLSTIESRIKEIIQDSMVLPNMDDIAFFNSHDRIHRGGIWPDAVRHEKTFDVKSVDGAPTIVETTISTDADVSNHQKSKSSEGLPADLDETSPPLEGVPITKAATTDESTAQTRTRKTSWFSISTRGSDTSNGDEVDEDRGRRQDMVGSSSPRGRSEPDDAQFSRSAPSDNHIPSEFLTPQAKTRRASSQHSAYAPRSDSGVSSAEEDDPFQDDASSRSQARSTGINTSSILATLKSRAGDKQALQNTAKEVARKWGWGKKGVDNESANHDDLPDHGTVEPRPRVDRIDSFASTLSQKARASYAEVRAHVSERRDKERNGNGSPPYSTPVPMQNGNSGKDRGIGVPGSPGNLTPTPYAARRVSDSFSASSSPSRPESKPTDPPTPPKALAPSTPQPTTEVQTTSTHATETHHDAIEDDVDEIPAPVPIYTQPSQARTMTIPGIHASHRGEVMSLGHVAQPQPQSPDTKQVISPAIQTVYRLWKTPSTTSSQTSTSQSGAESVVPAEAETETQAEVASALPAIELSSPPPARAPPPLPPRSTPPTQRRSSYNLSTAQGDPIPSSASEVLKSIVTRDENKRASMESSASSIKSKSRTSSVQNSPAIVAAIPVEEPPSQPEFILSPPPPVARPPPPLPPRRPTAPINP